jgi:hypothetical protein
MVVLSSVVSPAVSRGQMPTQIFVEALLWLVALLGSEAAYSLVSLSIVAWNFAFAIAAWNFALEFGAFRRFFEALEFLYGYSVIHSGRLPVLVPLARPMTHEGIAMNSMVALAV